MDMFALPDERNPIHTSLADKASLILIAPATANIIGKLACGICDDVLTCAVLSTKAPILIAPAMNDNMYSNALVQSNIARLKKLGFRFIGPVKGRLACGRDAIGHISDPAEIAREAKRLLK
jgi:phosphopantothenoylcysteine decarboxylase/phosphopantothenate--cysteine ligase